MTMHTPTSKIPQSGWTDEEIHAVIGPLLDEVSEAATLSYEERLRTAADTAVRATRAWLALYERQAGGEHVPFSESHEARERLQDAHRAYAQWTEIVAIGALPDGWALHSHWRGIAAYRDGEDEPSFLLPTQTPGYLVRFIMQTYDQAYRDGKKHGRLELQSALRGLLDVAAA